MASAKRASETGGAGTARLLRGRGSRVVAGLALIVVAVLALGVSAAGADTGIGISASPVVLDGTARPGESYTLGPVAVVNTGTEPITAGLRAGEEPGFNGRTVPPSWVQFEPGRVELAPQEQATVQIHLTVPNDVAGGDYQALVFAGVQTDATAGVNAVGAEAATRLSFSVDAAGAAGVARGSAIAVAGVGAVVVAGLLAIALAARTIARGRRHRIA